METKARNHLDLEVWQLSIELVVTIYQQTSNFPEEEKFGITNQIRRAAVSVPSNIAEGAGRSSSKEFIHFLSIALGSLAEIETQFILSVRLGYKDDCEDIFGKITSIRRMILGLISYLKNKKPLS